MQRSRKILIVIRDAELWLLWPMLLTAIGTTFYVYSMGYGSWVRPLNIPILGTILLALAVSIYLVRLVKCLFRRARRDKTEKAHLTLSAILCVLLFATFALLSSAFLGARTLSCRRKEIRRSCEPLIKQITAQQQITGTYPTQMSQFEDYIDLRRKHSLYLGDRQADGSVEWSPFEIGNSDISLFVNSNRFSCVVPIEKTSLITFSSFYAWRYESHQPGWVKTKIHWSLAGAYMD
ncbi:hypothetical protein ACFLS1_04640 [Verrucomicrobiota bacterium]